MPGGAPQGGREDDRDQRDHDDHVSGDHRSRIGERVARGEGLRLPGRGPQREAVPGGNKGGSRAEPGQNQQHGRTQRRAARPPQGEQASARPGRITRANRARCGELVARGDRARCGELVARGDLFGGERADGGDRAGGGSADVTGGPDQEGQRGSGGAGKPAEQAEHQTSAGQVRAAGDRRARVREEQAERHDAQPGRQQRADPHPGAPERDKHATRGPGGQVDHMSNQVARLRGQARPAYIIREQPGDPQGHAHAEEQRRHDGAASAGGHRRGPGGVCALAGPGRRPAHRGDRIGRFKHREPSPRGRPALLGFRPPLQRLRPGTLYGPDSEIVASAPYLVCPAPVRDGHLIQHGLSLSAPASAHPAISLHRQPR